MKTKILLSALAATPMLVAQVFSGPALAQAPSAYNRLLAACQGDAAKLCVDVPRGGGRVLACLKSQPEKLSPACRDALPEAEKLMNDAKPAK